MCVSETQFVLGLVLKSQQMFQPEVQSYNENTMRYILLNRPTAYNALNLPAIRTLTPLVKVHST